MISIEQMKRAEEEFAHKSKEAIEKARNAELSLENYTYYKGFGYCHIERQRLLEVYQEADYQAESSTWILQIIRQRISIINKT